MRSIQPLKCEALRMRFPLHLLKNLPRAREPLLLLVYHQCERFCKDSEGRRLLKDRRKFHAWTLHHLSFSEGVSAFLMRTREPRTRSQPSVRSLILGSLQYVRRRLPLRLMRSMVLMYLTARTHLCFAALCPCPVGNEMTSQTSPGSARAKVDMELSYKREQYLQGQ